MLKLRPILVYAGMLALLACSTVQVSQDYLAGANFSGLHTYAWQPQHESTDGLADNPLMAARIRKAIDETLLAKGYRRADRFPPDFHVDYRYTVRRQLEADSTRTGVGIGSWRGGYGFGFGTDVWVDTYDEALLFIDVIDPQSGKLLWRGKGTYRAEEHESPEETTASIYEVVEKILAQFPPPGV